MLPFLPIVLLGVGLFYGGKKISDAMGRADRASSYYPKKIKGNVISVIIVTLFFAIIATVGFFILHKINFILALSIMIGLVITGFIIAVLIIKKI